MWFHSRIALRGFSFSSEQGGEKTRNGAGAEWFKEIFVASLHFCQSIFWFPLKLFFVGLEKQKEEHNQILHGILSEIVWKPMLQCAQKYTNLVHFSKIHWISQKHSGPLLSKNNWLKSSENPIYPLFREKRYVFPGSHQSLTNRSCPNPGDSIKQEETIGNSHKPLFDK